VASQLRQSWADGRVKLLVTSACLRARAANAGPFSATAGYVALEGAGDAASSVLTCYRSGADGSAALAVVSRLAARLSAGGGDLPSGASYAGTVIDLPGNAPSRFVDALSGRVIDTDGRLEVPEVLAELPVALLLAAPPS
jgi:(1->4)-alpha-D-glucan 1-alpha-D-glucosylmutase